MIFAAIRYFLIGNLSNNNAPTFTDNIPLGAILIYLRRAIVLGVLLVLNIAILVLSSSVFSIANSDNVYRPIYVYLIFLGAFSCVFLIPIALIDLFRQGALPSRVLFELGWLIVFWIMHLAGASALTATPLCGANASCDETQRTLLIFAWLAVANLLVHLAALLVITLLHVNDIPEVWSMGVRDVPWFSKHSEGITPYTQEHSHAQDGLAPHRHQQTSHQPQTTQPRLSQSQPWHGRRRSRVRSWRDRFPSDSFSSQDRDNQHPPGDDTVDPARAFYPFLGQGHDANELRRAHDETVLPLPVAFTFERTAAPPQRPAQAATRTRSASRRESGSHPPNVRTEQPQVRQLPRTPEPEEQPPPRSRTELPPLPAPQSPQRPSRRVSNREAPQLVPLDISRSVSQRPQQKASSAASRGPPADSLLFSTTPQPPERPRRGAPPSATRLLPETNAFYGTAVQSVLRNQEENQAAYDSQAGEDRRSTTTRRVYASTPQPKPMSEAQAYAAEATRRSRRPSGSGRR